MKRISLINTAYDRDFENLEEEWMAALESLPPCLDDLLKVISWLMKVHETERAEVLLSTLLEALEEQRPGDATLEVARQSLDWFPESGEFRSVYARQLCTALAGNPHVRGIVEKSRLTQGAPLSACLREIECRLQVKIGRFAMHRHRGFSVRVESYEPATDSVALSDGERTFGSNLETLLDQYDWLADTDFRALQVFNPETLAELAESDPIELVARYLKTVGRESVFREFKAAITNGAVAKEQWKEWWSRVKTILINSPLIDLGAGGQPSLTLRDSPRDFVKTIRREFDFADHPRRRAAIALNYIEKVKDGLPPDQELVDHIAAELTQDLQGGDDGAFSFSSWLALRAAAEVLGATQPAYSPEWLAAPDARKTVAQWCGWDPSFQSPLLEFLPLADESWPERFAGLLPYSPLMLVEQLASALSAKGKTDALSNAVDEITSPTVETAEAFAWMWKCMATGEGTAVDMPVEVKSATLTLFKLIQQLSGIKQETGQNVRAALAALRHTVAVKRYEVIGLVFQMFGVDHATDIYQIITSNTGFSTPMRAQLVQILARIEKG